MTVINKVIDKTTTYDAKDQYGSLYSGFHRGGYFRRISSGGDRAAGSRPGFIKTYWNEVKPPVFRRGKIVVPQRILRKTAWKPDPNYQPYKVNHSYTAEYIAIDSGNGLVLHVAGAAGPHFNAGTGWNLIPFITSTTSSFSANDSIANLGKLREKIAGSSFNAGIVLGEAGKSLKMISESASSLYKGVKHLKRGDPIGAVRAIFGTRQHKVTPLPHRKDRVGQWRLDSPGNPPTLLSGSKDAVASNWLALQYGWKPLIQDIYEGAVFVDHQLRNPVTHRVSVTRYAGGNQTGEIKYVLLQNFGGNPRVPHRVIESERIVAFLTEKDTIRLSGLLDPLSVAWELLPWSFVFDWVIPVGNYLAAKSLANALTGTFVTTRRLLVHSTHLPPIANAGFAVDTKLNYSGNDSSYVKITRTVSTSLAVPLPSVKPLSKVASVGHAANAVALLLTLRK